MRNTELKIIFQCSTGLPLLIVKAQDKNLCFLLDTGSNINVLDRRVANFFILQPMTLNNDSLALMV